MYNCNHLPEGLLLILEKSGKSESNLSELELEEEEKEVLLDEESKGSEGNWEELGINNFLIAMKEKRVIYIYIYQ